MAGVTLSSPKPGRWRLLFYDIEDRQRRLQLTLGAIPKSEAEAIKRQVERLRGARIAHTTPPDSVSEWIASLPQDWHDKLAAAGLVAARESATRKATTLGELIDLFKSQAQWTRNAEGTRGTYERTFRHIKRRFGAESLIGDITAGHAKDLRPFLEGPKPAGCDLAVSTASATITQTKTLFELAVDYELLDRNPFRKLKTPQHEAAKEFVDRATSLAIMKQLPDAEWKLAFALARWGGVRIISEIRHMVWSHVDFANRELKILSQKTARHPHGGSRIIPLFDEIEPLMRQRFDEADEGELYVLPNARRQKSTVRDVMLKAIKSAELTPWAELFNSLRSTRETELVRQGLPLSEVAEVIGHSVRVAEKNYLQQMGRERRQAMLVKARTNSAHDLAAPSPTESEVAKDPSAANSTGRGT